MADVVGAPDHGLGGEQFLELIDHEQESLVVASTREPCLGDPPGRARALEAGTGVQRERFSRADIFGVQGDAAVGFAASVSASRAMSPAWIREDLPLPEAPKRAMTRGVGDLSSSRMSRSTVPDCPK